MAGFEIDVVVSPTLTDPPALLPFLRAGMEQAVEFVRVAGEANVTGRVVKPSGRPRKKNAPGYGPLAGSLTTHFWSAALRLLRSTNPRAWPRVLRLSHGPTDGVAGFVRTDVFYARFLEYGTQRAKDIVAFHRTRTGRPGMLKWGPENAPTFRRKVRPVGLGARHWMQDAAEGERPRVEELFAEQTLKWARAFAAPGPS